MDNAIEALNDKNVRLRVAPLRYTIHRGKQTNTVTYDDLKKGVAFGLKAAETESHTASTHSAVQYDLTDKLLEGTLLTRRTIAEILKGLYAGVFAQFKSNPESFIAEVIHLINEQKADIIVEHLACGTLEGKFGSDILAASQSKQNLSKTGNKLQNHVYDYMLIDSVIERKFVEELDTSKDVVIYVELPHGFLIPTPVGNYNPGWAISFEEGSVKHVYFVAETKGPISSLDLWPIKATKVKCACKFFDAVSKTLTPENVKYGVVDSFSRLVEVMK